MFKIDPYNSELYRFKVGAFFETQCIAIKNMNVMGVIKAWFALISASGTTVFQSRKYMIIIGTQCCIFITKTSLNFTMAKLLILAVN